ncbi:MAG: HlyD family efflux transporter periplasmic adaptor subunit, partial [Planctomycetota bacterium]
EGRPVRVGERVLTLVDPAATEVRFWIAEADNVIVRGEAGDAAADTGVRVFLNVHPEESLPATLDYIAPSVAPSPDSIPSFAAKAQWAAANPPEVEIGLEGTAILYGPRVSVLYWMFRRPLVAVRRFLQI